MCGSYVMFIHELESVGLRVAYNFNAVSKTRITWGQGSHVHYKSDNINMSETAEHR